ncbi:MAG: hypothetical protein AAGH64_11525 [Planctomycetota bacterium]
MIGDVAVQAVGPLELVTGEPVPGVLALVPAWAWIALGVSVLLSLSVAIVRVLGRDRSHGAEADRAFRKIARRQRLAHEDRRLLSQGARDASLEPVACLLSLGAFERAQHAAPAEFAERFDALRRVLFPEAGAGTLHA